MGEYYDEKPLKKLFKNLLKIIWVRLNLFLKQMLEF